MSNRNRKIDVILDALMSACGFVGESGSERFFWVLFDAVQKVGDEWHVVKQSHKDGLCYNVNALLSDAISEVMRQPEWQFELDQHARDLSQSKVKRDDFSQKIFRERIRELAEEAA
jgi:hypothetical protein